MKLKIINYEYVIYYWNSYEVEITIKMIEIILKDSGGYAENKKLYNLILKDGNRLYTDLAGYRKILKASRIHGVDLDVR